MASSNTIKDQILLLFPDNGSKEITAADMRTFVSAIFDTKEEIVVKIPTVADVPVYKAQIFEKSIVIVEEDIRQNNGIYISNANNPISILQCTKIAELDGALGTSGGNLRSDGSVPMDPGYTPAVPLDLATKEFVESSTGGAIFPPDSSESFLLTFNEYKVASEADYFYDINDNIESINVVNSIGDIFYTIGIAYDINDDISTKTITDTSGRYVTITFNYVSGIVVSKDAVLTIP